MFTVYWFSHCLVNLVNGYTAGTAPLKQSTFKRNRIEPEWIPQDLVVTKKIYADLLKRLASADIAGLAEHLNLPINNTGEAEIPFLGQTYLISNKGVRRSGQRSFPETTGSVLIHYLLAGSSSRPAGKFVPLAELAGPLFTQSSYSQSALEGPLVKRFQGRIPEFLSIAESIGGRQGGISGLGSVSVIFDVLPNILLQLIFYDKDDEFPARATLLLDAHATQLIDFEALAVLITIFVRFLIETEVYPHQTKQ